MSMRKSNSLSPTCVVSIKVNIGWRMYMEDAHIAIAPFTEKKLALFGVFDGHGGKCTHEYRG